MATYPSSIIAFTTKTNQVDLVDASHINSLQDEVVAIETELGKLVKGSATDLKTRLAKSLADSGVLASGTSFPSSPTDGQPFYRTDQDTFYIYDGAVWEASANLSNLIFAYNGQVDASASDQGEYTGTSLVPSAATGNYRFLQRPGNVSYGNIWTTRWTKIAGVSTVTILCRIWQQSGVNGEQCNLKVDIGGQNNNVSGTANQVTPEWKSFTIDVSSLGVGTVYDVTCSMRAILATNPVYCTNIVGIGS